MKAKRVIATRSISTPSIIHPVPPCLQQCERVSNIARRSPIPERNALGLEILKGCECLRWRWRNGVVIGTVTVRPIIPRVQIEAQLVTTLLGDAGAVEEDVD
jgi:hypothetical protein